LFIISVEIGFEPNKKLPTSLLENIWFETETIRCNIASVNSWDLLVFPRGLLYYVPNLTTVFCCSLTVYCKPALISDFAMNSFSYSASAVWNSLPADILFSDGKSGF